MSDSERPSMSLSTFASLGSRNGTGIQWTGLSEAKKPRKRANMLLYIASINMQHSSLKGSVKEIYVNSTELHGVD